MSTQPAGAAPPRFQRNHDSTYTNEPHVSNDSNEITVSTHTNETHGCNDSNESNEITVSTSPTVATKCALCDFVQTVA